MGIESDQLVYDYLSRVGDLAQQRQLPSGTRMRLVSELRNEIDRSRAKATAENPAAIRRILDRLGSPEDLVEAAASGSEGSDAGPRRSRDVPRPAVPTQRPAEPPQRPKRLRRIIPRPAADEPELPQDDFRPSPPHLAGTDELGPSGSEPDWWRVERDDGNGPFGFADSVPGFVGGVEIPEILKPPAKKRPDDEPEEEEWEEEEEEEAEGEEPAPRRRLRLRRPKAAADPRPGFSNPLLLLAAALLTVGAILGNWLALGGGWLLAYASRRLSRAEAKWAVLGLPGLSVAAGITWLWGRNEGRWGDPVRDGHMNDAMADTWPWVVRGAAVASALYLLWRSQRQRP
ncbi:hypothetical protein OG453_06045 [Streptomyces sp. NBC_01381]|uniref:hypothetical protein n=1 Tax=Streptomyces sp. NBC_01381 TaxID=2903845 RepID=UPI002257974B|nr:hypothetical protein [Streptomyces sp. NBC_01381]MCX4666228.1 hypothetical protein [Streptomyces sp. NBC_01381]